MTAAPTITLLNLIDRIAADKDLTATRRRDLMSDLRCLARLLEREPIAVPADLKALKRVVNDLHHAQLELTRKRLQNIRSSLKFVFDRYGIVTHNKAPLASQWACIRDRLETKRERDGLNALFQYCSACVIAPADLNDQVATDWLRWMTEETLRKKPRQLHRQACVIWNEVVDRYGLELPRLTVPDNRAPSFTLPWSDFPTAFTDDIDAHCRWMSGADLFTAHPPPRISKPSTIKLRRGHIRILASAAVIQGYPIEQLQSLRNLVSQDCVRAALEYYQTKLDGEFTTYVRDLTKTLISIAIHWVRDKDQVDWVAERLRRMGRQRMGLTEKNRNTLRHFDDPKNIQLLLGLPGALLSAAEKSSISDYRKAVKVQIALAIELLTAAPLRLENLATLRLDTHLTFIGKGKDRKAFISLPEESVKNGMPLEFPLPASTIELLDLYLKEYRPAIADLDNPWIFAVPTGNKVAHTLGQQMKATIYKEIGLKITPHQFRHISAKLYLDLNPGHYEVVRRLLGHKSLKTTLGAYTGLEMKKAVEHYDQTLDKLRADSTKRSRKRRKK